MPDPSALPAHIPSRSIADIERGILRVLCSRSAARRMREWLARELAGYPWQVPDHRVVYEALQRIRSRDPHTWRDQLPAQATRMGFPDVDWSIYLDSVETPGREIPALLRALKMDMAKRP
jgi:hypothetical protein